MLRGEFILRLLGTHPSEVLHQGMAAEYQELLQEGVERAVRAAVGKPVLYQLHDIAEHSFHGHRSWKRSTHEPNRQMGNRGSRRLLQEPDVLSLELQALGHLERQGHEQLALLLPMVRSLAEFTQLQRVIEKETPGYADRLWVRVETPALAIVADQLALAGPAGVVFDIPAIATLITGVDAENHEIGHERNQADPAVLDALRFAVASCRAHGVPTVVLGEHEALRPEIVEVAIRAGVTAVCVQPEEASWTRDLMASIEQKMLLDHVVGDGLEDPHHAHED
jgi:pyruvate,water dikinase